MGGVTATEQQDYVSVDVGGVNDVMNQSHLTKVVVGFDKEEDTDDEDEVVLGGAAPDSPEEILMQVSYQGCTRCV